MPFMKDWDALEIKDNFLFQCVMRYPNLCKALLEKIIDIRIKHIDYPHTEKVFEHSATGKASRLDVYVEDNEGTIYNVEMQTSGGENPRELAKRIRYYGAQIDMSRLGKGQDYEELPKRFIIFICTFDPFKRKRSVYTFQNRCVEETSLEIGDGATTIFLCTNGSALLRSL